MKTKSFQLKEILPNPFRRVEKYPLLSAKVDELCESIEATDFWENIVVRVNDAGRPELAYGHHRLAALRKLYPSTKEFDWIVKPLTDGVMIQMMARENGESYKTNAAVLRETISSAVEALGAGKILPEEMPIEAHTKPEHVRYAPSFTSCTAAVQDMQTDDSKRNYPYTIVGLAKFLGMVKSGSQTATNSFLDSFGALELIAGGYLSEARIKDLEIRKLGEVVASVKKQRDAAIAESQRLAREAEARRQEAIRKAEELKRQQEAAEARRKAAAEAERLAAIKRAEEKAKRDAEDKVRREEEEKQRKIAAEKRAKEEAARKEEEERLRKIREAQKAEADRQRAEAEKVRQAALAKAKKEDDERKAAQMVKDAEAARVRAEADAKRKEEAARLAEIAAKKREAEEKERQAKEADKREKERLQRLADLKERQEKFAREEALRIEEARVKAEAAKKAADEADRKKKAEIEAAAADAKRKEDAAKKEAAEAKAQVKAGADKLAAEAPSLDRDDIRARGQDIAEENAAKTGRAAASRTTTYRVSKEDVREFVDSAKKARAERDKAAKTEAAAAKTKKNRREKIIEFMEKIITSGLKIQSMTYHPDKGGSQEDMQYLNEAARELRQYVKGETR
jgi:chemotaxis protein histidine kinase CheA